MIKLRNPSLVFALLFILSFKVQSQDFPFSQFYANPLYLNPALAGSEYCSRFNLNYRNQWPSLPGAFTAYGLSWDRYSEFLNGGVGLQLHYDKQGEAAISQLMISGMYAYKLTISRDVEANLALQATYGQRGLSLADLVLPSNLQNNTATPPTGVAESVNYVDFAGGFLVGFSEKYFVGGAVHHPTQPEIGFLLENQETKMGMKITLHAGANFGNDRRYRSSYGSELVVSPNILYQQQGDFKQLNLGSYFAYEPFVFGLWFRHAFENPDAVILLVGLQHEQYRFGYSYDYTVSPFGNAAGGAHELSFALLIPCDKKSARRGAIKCPSF